VNPYHPNFLKKDKTSKIIQPDLVILQPGDDTHGDFVSGLIVGEHTGLAPSASIITFSNDDFDKAVKDAIKAKNEGKNIRVFNASFVTEFDSKEDVDKYYRNIKELERNGILFVSGINKNVGQPIATPADKRGYVDRRSGQEMNASNILYVGSFSETAKSNGQKLDVLSFFSPIDSYVCAPGDNRVSSATHVLKNHKILDVYNQGSGISFAIPVVSAIAALLFEKFPNATPAQIKKIIIDNSTGPLNFLDDPSLKKMFSVNKLPKVQ
jgi:Subtilase family